MPCYHPLPGWYSKTRNPSGKRSIVFKPEAGSAAIKAQVPCGRCIGCRLEKSRQWAMRCVHEAKLYEDNCFVTLTYDNEHVPQDMSLRPVDFVNFMKRLRFHHGPGIRFFHCGEYGGQFGRPHHHAILFNFDFADKRLLGGSGEAALYTSEELERLWSFGFCTVGAASFESAAYIARYSLKKVTGEKAAAHYNGRVPEYLTMSRRPGVGRGWLDKYMDDVYPSDEVVVRGVPCKPPRFYDTVLESMDEGAFAALKSERRKAAASSPDNSGSRLIVREVVKTAAISTLRRHE